MSQLSKVAFAIVLIAASGCANTVNSGSSTWFADDSVLHVSPNAQPADAEVATANKNSATLRIKRYSDLRAQNNPRLIGISNQLIRGVDGSQLLIDRDLADMITARLKRQFDLGGFVVLAEEDSTAARFEVTGVIKDLTLNVKYRDEIYIAIDTTVTDLQTGTSVWSGLVTEKNDRFAGVSGNTKQNVADYLSSRLTIALKKIVLSVNGALMSSHSELFNQLPVALPIPGVTGHAVTEGTASANVGLQIDAPPHGVNDRAVGKIPDGAGTLQVSTSPPRAGIYISDVYFGLTPLRLEMSPGVYPVAIKLDGYRTVSEKVSVRKGDNTEMELTLEH
ncbi:MAG: PEGA domain-containing protein [Gallionella sp.]